MALLDKIEVENKDLRGLPLFYKRIFHNQLTYIGDEEKLFYYDNKVQSVEMRINTPTRNICKMTHKE
jgi:hypothetical protein